MPTRAQTHRDGLGHSLAALTCLLALLVAFPAQAEAQTDLNAQIFIFGGGSPTPEGATLRFNLAINRSLKKDETVTIPLTIAGTATQGVDYRMICRDASPLGAATCHKNGNAVSVTFHGSHRHWRNSIRVHAPFALQTIEDHTVETDETVDISLNGAIGGTAISDAPASTTITFLRERYSLNESDLEFQPVLGISSPSGRELTVPLIFTDITAKAGRDYKHIAQTVIPATGATTSSFIISLRHKDALAEPDKTFRVAFDKTRLPAGVTTGAISEATFTIKDDDPIEIRIHRYGAKNSTRREYAPVTEGTGATFTVSALNLAYRRDVTVDLSVSEDSSEGQDFVASAHENAQTLTFNSRDGLAHWFEVPTVNDNLEESDGGVTVQVMPSAEYVVHPSAPEATVEVLDDDMARDLIITPSTPFAGLALAEGGSGSYSVRLSAPPSGLVVVSIGGHDHTNKIRPSTERLEFTRENWGEPQSVHVTSRSDDDEDDEVFTFTHAAAGSLYSGVRKDLRVTVRDDDPPDRKKDSVEIAFHQQDDKRVATESERTSRATHVRFFVRTDKPHSSELHFRTCFGGSATWDSDYKVHHHNDIKWVEASLTGRCLDSFIRPGRAHRELRVVIQGDACPERSRETVEIRISERADHPLPAPRSIDDNLHVGYVHIDDDDGGKPACDAPKSPGTAPNIEIPDTPVSGVQVSAIDDASATVTWNTLEHASSYQVEWSGEGAESLIEGALPGITGTTTTIDHSAPEAMTLNVKVIPAYVDGNGDTQLLADLAGTATLDVAPAEGTGSTDSETHASSACVPAQVRSDVEGYADESDHGSAHVERWMRALAAFGDTNGHLPMKAAEARDMMAKHTASRWQPVVDALKCLQAADAPAPEHEPEPEPEPEIRVSAGDDVTEGENAEFTVHADPAPHTDLTVDVTVAQIGDWLNVAAAGIEQVTIAAGASSASVALATEDDDTDEAEGSLSVTLNAGTGYTLAASPDDTASVALRDNDAVTPVNACVSEALYQTVTAYSQEAHYGQAHVERWMRALAAFGNLNGYAAMSAAEARSMTAQYMASRWRPVLQAIECLDAGAQATRAAEGSGVSLSVAHASVDEGPNAQLVFTVRLSEATQQTIRVNYLSRDISAIQGEDYASDSGTLSFNPYETEKQVRIAVHDDAHDEGSETMELLLFNASGARIENGVGVGTIVNSDPMPKAWLARFGRAVADQALEGIETRIGASGERTRQSGLQGTLAGASISHADIGEAAGLPRSVEMFSDADSPMQRQGATQIDFAHLLAGSRFTYTSAEDASGGILGFWGRASQTHFDGQEGNLNLDAEVVTALLGADYARDNWLVGVALTGSFGDGGYRDSADGTADSRIETSLTAAIPYASLSVSERLSVWGAAGRGVGELRLNAHNRNHTVQGKQIEQMEQIKADIDWTMAAAGLRSELFEFAGGTAVALVSDALWSRTASQRTQGLIAAEADVSRLRLGVEGSRRFVLPGGGSLEPMLEVGARHDGGDAETGLGVEVGGGVAWSHARLGLKFDIKGRALLTHEDGAMRDTGFSLLLAFDPRPASARGLSLALRQDTGSLSSGGLDAMFARDPLSGQMAADANRWTAEMGYGVPTFGGRFVGTPHIGYSVSHGAREIGIGLRLSPEARPGVPDFSLAIRTARRDALNLPVDHRIGIEARVVW